MINYIIPSPITKRPPNTKNRGPSPISENIGQFDF